MISRSPSTPLVFRLMLRELREGLSGFRIFLACLILGIAAIAGVGSLSAALLAGMADQGRVLLAGDAEIRSQHQDFTAEQQEWIKAQGQISRSVRGRTNAFAPATDQRTLVEFRAVDAAYPHYGALETSPQMDHQGLFGPRDGQWGIAVDETLATRLDLDLGGSSDWAAWILNCAPSSPMNPIAPISVSSLARRRSLIWGLCPKPG
ncbi:hypothetical protein JCM17846_21150 [Iodidimonas nitroreducens]|uniref:MacB-like periplasmic core domain-containing protein n=1 Tax=Iodidimonas nitroreducens TaxID=1236968 RepID=A0A5A7N7W6_9PROT|nr:hypothetical protein [Iodidimonas nitroreducens]GER04433.1 hypothetical protein JCM17846_21150 [Iodidimonas nitroreducens]